MADEQLKLTYAILTKQLEKYSSSADRDEPDRSALADNWMTGGEGANTAKQVMREAIVLRNHVGKQSHR